MAQSALGAELKVDNVVVNEDIARIVMYNEELGVTVSQMWQLTESAEDAAKAQLKLIDSAEKYSPRAAEKYTEAQKKKIDQSNKWLIGQMSKLNRLEGSYQLGSKKIDGTTLIGEIDETSLNGDVEKTIDGLAKHIKDTLKSSMDGVLTEEMKNTILNDMRILDNEIRSQQLIHYTNTTMSASEIEAARKVIINTINDIASDARKKNVFDQIKDSYDKLHACLTDSKREDYIDTNISDAVNEMRVLRSDKNSAVHNADEIKNLISLQDKLYASKRKLQELDMQGVSKSSSEYLQAERVSAALESQYNKSLELLSVEEKRTEIKTRQAQLETELTAALNEQQKKIDQQHYTSKQYIDETYGVDTIYNPPGGGGGGGGNPPSGGGPIDPNRIKEQYQSVLNLVNEINAKNERLVKLGAKDKGTGMLSQYTTPVLEELGVLQSELKTTKNDIDATLGEGFVQGQKQIKLPLTDSLGIAQEEVKVIEDFLNSAQTQAVLTIDEINNLVAAFQKTQNIEIDFQGDLISENLEKAKQIKKEDAFFKNTNQIADVENVKLTADSIEKLGVTGSTAKEQLESLAQTIAKNSNGAVALTKNFTLGADGIAKLDFSIFNQSTGHIEDFTIALGTATGKIGVYKTTIDKSLSTMKSAEKQLMSTGNLLSALESSGVSTKKDDSGTVAQVQNILKLQSDLQKAMQSGDSDNIANLTKRLKLATSEAEKLFKQMIQMEGAIDSEKLGNLGKGDPNGNVYNQLVNATQQLVGANQNATVEVGRFDSATNTLNASLVHSNGTIENFKLHMDALSGQITSQASGVTKLTSTWDRFKSVASGAGKQLLTAFAGYNVFYKAIAEVRKGIGYVKEIDLAMTELKKVTDETDESYAKFLNTAAGTAGNIGSTVSDFTEATANFARLGYTMEESANMAETAIMYKNVADGLDTVKESTDSIISTMKAFGIESNDTMGIIDRFNEVGNNFAITSAGIGEALQRSASALYAGGNTIDESIALVTAANSVIQNPEQVGEEIAQQYSNILLENSYIG